MKVTKKLFGADGATLFVIENDHGLILEVTNFGARIVRFLVPTKTGELVNIVLGFDDEESYRQYDTYFGATIGRVAGRLAKGQYQGQAGVQHFDQNEGPNTLHGGANSFEVKRWETEIIEKPSEVTVIFSYRSPDGENGFKGNLKAKVAYTFNNQDEWRLDYEAETDQETLYNPTNHAYFNLSGSLSQPIDAHLLYVAADRYGVIDEESLPTGELRAVTGTAFDFTDESGRFLHDGFSQSDQQIALVSGYDHPFALSAPSIETCQARLTNEASGITLEMRTDSPAVVIYTTNIGEKEFPMFGETVSHHSGITLETQVLPDAINHQGFGTIKLEAGETFKATTVFSIK